MPFSRGLGKEILYICISGACALLVFYLIRPVGFRQLSNTTLFEFGLLSIVLAIIYVVITHFFHRCFLEHKNWTIGLELLHSLLFLVFIGAGIMIYGYLIDLTNLSLSDAILYLFYTLLLGIIPVSIRIILVRNWRLKEDLNEAKKINELLANRRIASDEKIIEFPVSRNETLKLTNQDLTYIESTENYITVVWSTGREIKKLMIRMTMKDAMKLIDDPLIVFCHRSFIINLRKVLEIIPQSGTSLIVMKNSDNTIPVSNTYKSQIKQKLKEI